MTEYLYCVGCDRAVIESRPGQTIAIACSCGANAPILYKKGASTIDDSDVEITQRWATPASLLRASLTAAVPIPHLEYYLGFSDHQSELKTEITRMLRALGAISYTECKDEHCRKSFERSKKIWQDWQNRLEQRRRKLDGESH